ncbi:DegV family protein ['Cynodon dactylon' phytoplasma]|nr:DegV family protein ['Cynodon dactylon' phytoplasma]
MNIKVSSISTSCLDYYKDKPKNIDLIRIKIFIDNKEYIDGKDITPSYCSKLLKENYKIVIKTSQPSLGDLITYFKDLFKKGYKKVFIPTLSPKLSGTYNTVVQAKKILQREVKKFEIIPYDTNTISFSEGYFAIEAERLFSNGFSVEKVIKHLDWLKKNNTIFFIVNSLDRLIFSGRLNQTKGFFGRLFRIKPILQLNENCDINIISKKIQLESAFSFIIKKIKDYIEGVNKKNFLIYLLYVLYEDKIKDSFKKSLEKEFQINNILEIPVSSSILAHLGNNVIGVGIIKF